MIYKVSDSQSIRIESIEAIEKVANSNEDCLIFINLSHEVKLLDVQGNNADHAYTEILKLMKECHD